MSWQQIQIVGNLTDDPEMKYVGETEKTTFSVACNERYGEKEETTFFNVECWAKLAEIVAEHKRKGDQVLVIGRMKRDQWEDKETERKREKWYVRADRVVFIGGKRRDDGEERPRRRSDDEPRGRQRSSREYEDLTF